MPLYCSHCVHNDHHQPTRHRRRNEKAAIRGRLDEFVVWPLYLFCIFKKIIYVVFKRLFVGLCIVVSNFFAVNNRHAFKRHIVVIALATSITIGTVIFNPSGIEAFNKESGKMSFEIGDSVFNFWVFFSKDWINSEGIFWPRDRGGIKTFEFVSDYVLKFTGCNKISNAHVAEQTNNSRTQENNYINDIARQREQQIDEIFHGFLFWSFIGFWLAVILASLKS